MKSLTLIIVFCMTAVLAGFPAISDEDALRHRLMSQAKLIEELSNVKISDGISREEAIVIARNFAAKYILCGGFRNISEEEKYWIVNNAVGYFGKSDSSTRISKENGIITTTIANVYGEIHPYHIWD